MLPINFHRTFVPERRLIGALLHYAARGRQGTYQQIAADTGIPMGDSTGKVPAILDYARGMGLVELAGPGRSATKRPVLTAFGQVVYSADSSLGEKLTQWLAHLNLCRGDIGAMAWRSVFAEGRRILGGSFSRQQVENYLMGIHGSGKDRTGPLIRTYLDGAALGRAGVLASSEDILQRQKAPLLDSYAYAYSAFFLTLMEVCFPGQAQITLSDLSEKTLCFDVCLWSEDDIEWACSLLDRKGLVRVDREMRPWILERVAMADSAWPHIFDDLA